MDAFYDYFNLHFIEGAHYLDGVNARDVTESLGQALVLIIDDEGTTLLEPPPVPQLALAGSGPLGLVHLVNIVVCLVPLEEDHGLLGLGKSLDLVGHDQGNFGSLLDAVT